MGVTARLTSATGETVHGTLCNISLGGAMLVLDDCTQVNNGYTVVVEFSPPADQIPEAHLSSRIEFAGQIVRCEPTSGVVAMRITQIARNDLRDLKEMIQQVRVQTAVRCQVLVSFDLQAKAYKQLGTALLKWRAGQPRGAVQHFDTHAVSELLAGKLPPGGVVRFSIWESAFDPDNLASSLKHDIAADLVRDVDLGGTSWNDADV
jgi:hypothetical protein